MAEASILSTRKSRAKVATTNSVAFGSRGGLGNSGSQSARKRKATKNSHRAKVTKRFKHDHRYRKPRTEHTSSTTTELPPWPLHLPYTIMLQIFQTAAYPICDAFGNPNSSVAWLLGAALVCKSFLEPALAALYFRPPLLPLPRAHKLLRILENSETTSINYPTKIKHLDIEVVEVLSLKPQGLARLDLLSLIKLCPQLHGIAFHLHEDIPGYRGVHKRTTAVYKETLFDELDKIVTDLRSFKWNFHIMTNSDTPWNQLSAIHSRRCFRNVSHLEIAHFGDIHKGSKGRWTNLAQQLKDSLGRLEHLQGIRITKSRLLFSCDLFRNIHMLKSLRFDDCDELDSDHLSGILQIQGSRLQELVLKHNRRLNLEFTAYLANNCQGSSFSTISLEVLEVDFQCFNSLSTGGAEVLFQSILLPGTTPTWPVSLSHLKLVYLRKWDLRLAAHFFNSLWTSATHLPNLRTLEIRSCIEEGWKERKEFRNLWVKRMETAFRRQMEPPHRFYELASNRLSPRTTDLQEVYNVDPSRIMSLGRKSTTSPVNQTVDTGFLSQPLSRPTGQPMCETVNIHIDNLRPMQTMYREEDFIDSEPSGDEEWNGDDNNAESTYAW